MDTAMKLTRVISLAAAIAGTCLLSLSSARTWTSADGTKTFEGELKSYDPEKGLVGVTLANGKPLSFPQDKLSAADIAFLKETGKFPAAAGTATTAVKSVPDEIPAYDGKEADMSKPVQVFIMMGQSNMVGLGNVEPVSKNGSLAFYC